MPVLCGVQAFDDSDSVSGSVIEPVRNFANCEGADKRKLAKVSSVVRMESVTHSSEMTTMTLANDVAEEGSCKDSVDSPKVATPDSTTTTADVSYIVDLYSHCVVRLLTCLSVCLSVVLSICLFVYLSSIQMCVC